jgi:hypothetical protein
VKLLRDVRHCPECGAYRGFACNETIKPDCPQRQAAPDPAAELDMTPATWPFGVPPEDAS